MEASDDVEVVEDFFKTMPKFNNDEIEGIEHEFSEAQLEDFQNSFKKIDKGGTGAVDSADIGSLLRAVGLNPTLKLIGDITQWLYSNKLEKINFEDFKKILSKVWEEPDYKHELKKAFEALDPMSNGYLTVDQLKKILLNFGETLDENDFKEILKTVPVQPDETINIDDIVSVLATNFKA